MSDYFIEKYPMDGSMRMMEKTEFEIRLPWKPHIIRKVYRHKPTGKLYYSGGGCWYGTYTEYCYNTKTHEKGIWF